jgi:catechol 2,3-dioxygenase-like lactoylglutathione lyase family enzyme
LLFHACTGDTVIDPGPGYHSGLSGLCSDSGTGYFSGNFGVRGTEGQKNLIKVETIDHIVLTVADIENTVDFYHTVLGMEKVEFGEGRVALAFGNQKINLHRAGNEFEPKAGIPQPGSADLCFMVDTPVVEVIDFILNHGIEIIEGPVARTGAAGPILSLYFRDPDGNPIEISNYN